MINYYNDIDFVEEDRLCAYIEDVPSDIRYKFMERCTIAEYQELLERGWRRFGRLHFTPVCKNCDKCVSMRILVDEFEFSKSNKRTISKNQNTKLVIKRPSVTMEHLALYDKYHSKMSEKKGWSYSQIDPLEYKRSYVNGAYEYGYEFLYFSDSVLIGVALVDILPNSISSIYCYYDHDYEDLSIGKFSILMQLKIAKNLNIPYIYLGYWIENHKDMGYKELYKPFEVLTNRVELDTKPTWRRYE